jgi:hypothetical protein
MLGAVAEPAPRRRAVTFAPAQADTEAHDRVAADEPVAAERREIGGAPVGNGAQPIVSEPADEPAPVR